LSASHAEEWTHKAQSSAGLEDTYVRHRGETPHASPAQKLQQKRLALIIQMMPEGDCGGLLLPEYRIARLARRAVAALISG
jgi:hypothetical protein